MSSAASASGSSDGRRGGSDAAAAVAVVVAATDGEGFARGQFALAMDLYEGGNGVEKDLEKGTEMLKAAAHGGLAEAQVELGRAYLLASYGFTENFAEAVKWLRRAADQGNAEGQFGLGYCYQHGHGVDKDEVDAARLFRLSAEQGCAEGQEWLGFCYRDGVGVNEDHEEAVRWYRLAVDQGHAAAQSCLGVCYRDGVGVQQDYLEAARLYELAADQDDEFAQNELGYLYFNGDGVQRNCDTALHWLRLSGQTDDDTTDTIAAIEKSAQELVDMKTDTQFTMIEAGESVFGQAQDGTGDYALHVAARQMQADTVALFFDHSSFDDLVKRANTAGELPRDVVSHKYPRKVDTREARALRSILSVSRRTRSACVLWCFEVLRDVAPERLVACIPRDMVREIVQHVLPPAPPGSLLCGAVTLFSATVAWPRPCLAIAPPIMLQPTTPQDVIALQLQQQQQTSVVVPLQQQQQRGPGVVQGVDESTLERGTKRTLGESVSTPVVVNDVQSGEESGDLEPANKRSRS